MLREEPMVDAPREVAKGAVVRGGKEKASLRIAMHAQASRADSGRGGDPLGIMVMQFGGSAAAATATRRDVLPLPQPAGSSSFGLGTTNRIQNLWDANSDTKSGTKRHECKDAISRLGCQVGKMSVQKNRGADKGLYTPVRFV